MIEKISPSRTAAVYVLSRCRNFDAWSTQTLLSARQKFMLDDRDAALCERLCLTVLQNAALCDFYIGHYSSVPTSKMEPVVLDILRLGTVQLLFMDRIPASAAVDQSVALAKKSSRSASGLVNAVLRRISENKESLPAIPGKGTAGELSILYSHPLWHCEKFVTEYGYDFTKAYLAANNSVPGLTVSVNLTQTDAVSFARDLNDKGYCAETNGLSNVSVDISGAGPVQDIPGFKEGAFFVQDAAAALSVVRAAPLPGSRVLDLCAAPGGKSLLCASLMRNHGEIISCDLHEKKLRLVEENARRLGFDCIHTRTMDAAEPDTEFYKAFDVVIADVPCSGMGVIRKKPEIRYKREESLRGLPAVQLRILRGAAQCVRPGGILLYSTCTVFHQENEDVTAAFLSGHKEFSVEESRLIWPQEHSSDGFYYCKMRRNDDDQ